MKYFLALILSLTLIGTATAAVYYIDAKGNVITGTTTISALRNRLDEAKAEKQLQATRCAEQMVPYQSAVDQAKADLDAAIAAKRVIIDTTVY